MVRRPVGIFYSAWWMGFLWLLLNSGMGGVCAEVWADEVNVQASVDRTRVRVGDTFTLTVSVQGEGQANTPELDLPNGFNVVGSASSSSTSISIVNGQMSTARTTSFVFSLEPTQQGAFTLGPVRVVSNGKTYKSAPIRMEVVAGGGAPQRTRPAPGQNVSSEDLRQIEENLYILAETDKKQAYVGEQVTLTYTLYTRFNLQNVHYGKQPTFTGFWAETIFDAQRLDQRREIVDGRAFNAARLKEVALFPTSQGRQSLEQLEMVCDIPVQSRRRSVFDRDDFFSFDPFGQSRQVTVRSEDIGLDVLPLPPGAPSEFSGAVGQFQISASATPVQVRQGDPVSLKIAVSGTGNLGAVSQPVPASEDGFKLYDPKASVETETRNGRVGGRKLFEYVVIPQVAGKIEIPAFRLAYFDPNLKRYRTVETEAVSLVVTPGETEQVAAVPALSRQEVQVLGKDIRHIKPDLNVLEDQGGVL
ncbi:MAG: BatD family protein, partial [bacterium]|nr:BatD family protein [bacterium]